LHRSAFALGCIGAARDPILDSHIAAEVLMPWRLRTAVVLAIPLALACADPGTDPDPGANPPPHINLPLLELEATPATATGEATFKVVAVARADSGLERGLAVITELWVDCNGNTVADAGETAGASETVRLECSPAWPDPLVPTTHTFQARARQSGGALVIRDAAVLQQPATVPAFTGRVLSALDDGTQIAGTVRINNVAVPFQGGLFSIQNPQINEGTHAARLTGNLWLQEQSFVIDDGVELMVYVIPATFDLHRLRGMLERSGSDYDQRATVRLPPGVVDVVIDDRYVHEPRGADYARVAGSTSVAAASANRVREAVAAIAPYLRGMELRVRQLSSGSGAEPDLSRIDSVASLVYVGQLANQAEPLAVDLRQRLGEVYFSGIWLRADAPVELPLLTAAMIRALGLNNAGVEEYTVNPDGRLTEFGGHALRTIYSYPAGSGTQDIGLLSWRVNSAGGGGR
jgi:hypothetical protein